MSPRSRSEETETLHTLTAELLEQGRRLARAGMFSEAAVVTGEAWSLAQRCDRHLASAAACEIAGVLLCMGNRCAAAEWFARAATPLTADIEGWPAQRARLARLCEHPAGQADELTLRVNNLGRLAVWRNATLLPPCRATKSFAVFRYLLTRRYRTAHQEELMELIWPDAAPRMAAHSLQMAVSTVRRHLNCPETNYLVFCAGYYEIPSALLDESDSDYFVRCCEEAEVHWHRGVVSAAERAYSRASEAYAGDYDLDGHSFPWAIAERERLLGLLLVALDRRGRLLMELGRFEEAVGCYRGVVARDDYREDAHRRLMRCYERLGRRGEALRQYEYCADVLARDLGIEPLGETRDLYHAIRDGTAYGDHQESALQERSHNV